MKSTLPWSKSSPTPCSRAPDDGLRSGLHLAPVQEAILSKSAEPLLAFPDGRTLVERDRVHRSCYTDEAIFQQELKNIFYKTWIYAGHESQIRKPGDYVTFMIGRQPMLLVRGEDGRNQRPAQPMSASRRHPVQRTQRQYRQSFHLLVPCLAIRTRRQAGGDAVAGRLQEYPALQGRPRRGHEESRARQAPIAASYLRAFRELRTGSCGVARRGPLRV